MADPQLVSDAWHAFTAASSAAFGRLGFGTIRGGLYSNVLDAAALVTDKKLPQRYQTEADELFTLYRDAWNNPAALTDAQVATAQADSADLVTALSKIV